MRGCTIVGTYAGIVEKLGYLKRLGVNAIELLPVHEFNELEYYAVCTFNPTSCSPKLASAAANTMVWCLPCATQSLLSLQIIPGTDDYRFNFWGYSTVNFFSPMARYSQVLVAARVTRACPAPCAQGTPCCNLPTGHISASIPCKPSGAVFL
jgi:isoamylase